METTSHKNITERVSGSERAHRVIQHLRGTLGTGLLLIVPIVITYIILRMVFNVLDGVLSPTIETIAGRELPGLGLVSLVVLIYLSGLLGSHVLGKRVLTMGQNALLRTPVVGAVYSASKLLIESFTGSSETGFKRVVVIEYPRQGSWGIGFLTAITEDGDGNEMAMVYLPTAPMPNSGWVAMLPVSDVYDTELSVPQAMQLVLSGGIVTPGLIRRTARLDPEQPLELKSARELRETAALAGRPHDRNDER